MKSTSLLVAIFINVFCILNAQTVTTTVNSAFEQNTIFGTVTDYQLASTIPFVTVKVSGLQQFITETDTLGYFELVVDTGNYVIEFIKVGYDTNYIDTLTIGITAIEVNSIMHKCQYPVRNVTAVVADNGESCLISWELPKTVCEIIYDGGKIGDYKNWTSSGTVAVKFTPDNYPVIVTGGRLNVGDGSFPPNNYFLNNDMRILVMDDDGENEKPGTILDYKNVKVVNYGWVDFNNIFNIKIEEGNFYICMQPLRGSQGSAPVGVDTLEPYSNRSYSKYVYSNIWNLELNQNYMIRAVVDNINPGATTNGAVRNEINNYTISKVEYFNPCTYPANSTVSFIGNSDTLYFTDNYNSGQPPYYYGYAVSANYEIGTSVLEFSNVVPPQGTLSINFNIALCDTSDLNNSIITMVGDACEFNSYQLITDTNGIAIIDTVLGSLYSFTFDHIGYEIIKLDSILIANDTSIAIELTQKKYPPRNMYVDTLTNVATWDQPLVSPLAMETFEDTLFPPQGWQRRAYLDDRSWWRTDNFSFDEWQIPPGDGFYTMAYTDFGSAGLHPLDYLITPQLDLRESLEFVLVFDQYYDGAFGQSGYVEISYDNGITWDTIAEMEPNGEWNNVEIDLSEFSGPETQPSWIAFHSSDHNSWGSGWAVDNVAITNGPAEILGYNVSLNNIVIAQTDNDVHTYSFENLVYRNNYTACVTAIYTCGVSTSDCFSWESDFLHTPANFFSTYEYNTPNVSLFWNPPTLNVDSIPPGLLSFNIYENDSLINSVLYTGQSTIDTISYTISNLNPATYYFAVAAIYDLSAYGFPNEIGESALTPADTIEVIWGVTLPFYEDWNTGNFDDKWIVNDTVGNWRINTSVGNPEPIAEFNWQPSITGHYESSITSTYIHVDSISEGNIFFDFDLRLRDRNITGNEKLKVEVFDGKLWHDIIEFANNGTTLYISHHLDISDYLTGNIFKIRFVAFGENLHDLYAWFIDNINIYRECDAPSALTIDVDYFTFENPAIEICWEAPYHIAEWMMWDNGENYTGIGLTNGGVISAATRWNTDQLAEYDGASITKIRYFVLEGFTSIVLNIWEGTYSGTLIYEEDVTASSQANEWNEIALTNPIPINIVDDLLVGYTITHMAGALPAGTDSGPAIVFYGDLISTDGGVQWDPLSGFGYNYNWNIEVFVEEIPFSKSPTPIIGNKTFSSNPTKLAQGPINETPKTVTNSNSRLIQGFNIYRMEDGGDYELYDVVDYIYGQTSFCYFDTVPNVNLQNGYYYKVTSTWQSDIDYCESAPAKALDNPDDDFVYIFLENTNDIPINNLINIFPNPAKNYITITSALPISNIRIINYVGQEVFNSIINGVTVQNIVTSNYQTGVYIVEITTNKKVLTNKIIITH